MSDKDYKVTPKLLNEADFRVLILTIPAADVEDKLTYLAREKGKITRTLYEDFLIATCIANINQLLFHINSTIGEQPVDMTKVREELIGAILGANPLLDSSNIYVNHNYVLKLLVKGEDVPEDSKLLNEIKTWGMNPQNVIDAANSEIEEHLKGNDLEKNAKNKANATKVNKVKADLKDLDDLEYTVIERWWKRVGKYIPIKKFNKEDIEHILGRRFFYNRKSFQTFIVSVCVEDFEGVFNMVDDMGITGRVAGPILMNELYELCRYCNDFLTYENAQQLSGKSEGEEEDPNAPKGSRRRSASTSMSQYAKNVPKRTFKMVPKKDLLNLAENMKIFLVGQDEAIDTLTNAIKRARVGLKDPERPIGSFLFAGRTGVGKTLATKILANELIKSRDNRVIIDCSEYSADHEYSKLIGSPMGYVGHESGGLLTNAVQKSPFCVVVFDEIEKASQKVHELLLQILEEGRLTDGKGKPAYFNDAIIIMTSNIGAGEIDAINKTIGFGDVSTITEKKKDVALKEALKRSFKPEFLNRVDAVVNFRTLTKQDYMRIIDLELYKLNDNLKGNSTDYSKVILEFSNSVCKKVYKEGIDEDYGARPLRRCIQKEISDPLSDFLLLQDEIGKINININFFRNKIKFISTPIEEEEEEDTLCKTEEYKDIIKNSSESVQ